MYTDLVLAIAYRWDSPTCTFMQSPKHLSRHLYSIVCVCWNTIQRLQAESEQASQAEKLAMEVKQLQHQTEQAQEEKKLAELRVNHLVL